MTENKIFSYSIFRQSLQAHPRFVKDVSFTPSSAYRDFSTARDMLVQQVKLLQINRPEELSAKIAAMQEADFGESRFKAFKPVYDYKSGEKDAYVILFHHNTPSKDAEKYFYSYYLLQMPLAVCKMDIDKDRRYDFVLTYDAPLFSDFDVLRLNLMQFCASNMTGQVFKSIQQDVSEMSLDITNIGQWHKTFKQDTVDVKNGHQEWRLIVYRMLISG